MRKVWRGKGTAQTTCQTWWQQCCDMGICGAVGSCEIFVKAVKFLLKDAC